MKFKKFSNYLTCFIFAFALALGLSFTTSYRAAASGVTYIDSSALSKAASLQSDINSQQVISTTNQGLYNTYNSAYIYTRAHLASYPDVLANLRTIDPTKSDSYWQTTYGTTTLQVSTNLAKAVQNYQNLMNQANLKIAQDKTQLAGLNYTSLTVKDISLSAGSTFDSSQAFVSATDATGSAVALSAISVTASVNTSVPGNYTVSYSYGGLTNVATITVTPVAATTTVSYKSDTGSMLTATSPVTFSGNSGQTVTVPAAPSIAGYAFSNVTYNGNAVNIGDSVILTSNASLVYSYTQNPVAAATTISYISSNNVALSPTNPATVTGNVGQSVVVPIAPVITGYTFSNVTYNGIAVTPSNSVILTSNGNLVYSYTQNSLASATTISYVSDSNVTLTPTSPVTLVGNVGQSVTVPLAPTIIGYNFSSVTYNGATVTAGNNITLLASASLVYTYTQNATATSPITVSTPITVPQSFPGSTWDSSIAGNIPFGVTFTIQTSATSTTTAGIGDMWITSTGVTVPEMTFSGIVNTGQLGTQYITATYHLYDGSTVSGSIPVEVVAPAKPTLVITMPSNPITIIQGDPWDNSVVASLTGVLTDIPAHSSFTAPLSMMKGVTFTGTIDTNILGTQYITVTFNNPSYFADTVSVQVPVTVVVDSGPIYRTAKGQALATVDPNFNARLEAAMLTEINNYRAYYGMSALTMTSATTNFAHSNITWTVDPANSSAGPHAYFMANSGSFMSSAGYNNGGEVATYVNSAYALEANNVLSSAVDIKDTINYVSPTTMLNIDYLNKAYNDPTALQQLAYSLVYMYGDDGQPIGYAGTTAATQGTAHKQGVLEPYWKYVAFGEGLNSNGDVEQVIDFFD